MLSILHLNIRSLNSKTRELNCLLELLVVKFDIVILTEIWTYNVEFYANILGKNNYEFFHDLPKDSNIGGVGIYTKKSLNAQIRDDIYLKFDSSYKCENVWLDIYCNGTKILIGGIYRHPNQNLATFQNSLDKNLSAISKKKRSCYIFGDMNADFLKYEINNSTKSYLDNLLSYNFMPLLLLPTRVTSRSCTLIDHIYQFANQSVKKSTTVSTGNILSDISDHFPNFLILNFKNNNSNPVERPFIRVHNTTNKRTFEEKLESTDWTNALYNINDVNLAFDSFSKMLTNNYHNSFPLTKISKKANKDKKWITKGLKTSCCRKNELYKIWLNSQNVDDKNKYVNYKRTLSRALKSAERDYYAAKFSNNANNSKLIWRQINDVCSYKKSSNKPVINHLLRDGKFLKDNKEIANAFNDFFCKIGSNMASNFKNNSDFKSYLGPCLPNSMLCFDITSQEIINAVASLASKKSTGSDNLPSLIFKDHCHQLVEPLQYLFNLSLDSGIVPDVLKLAKVIPIHKKGDKQSIDNYRPISLLNVINTIFEKILQK